MEEDWPLYIKDHQGHHHQVHLQPHHHIYKRLCSCRENVTIFRVKVFMVSFEVLLAPGEMVWYESAKLVHGRLVLYNFYFGNMYLYFSVFTFDFFVIVLYFVCKFCTAIFESNINQYFLMTTLRERKKSFNFEQFIILSLICYSILIFSILLFYL